ncbi:MAG TPA: hypothetical protein VFO18_13250 [Methylomirabilota bacterium]|nr:hypothetical protein [Methylomirabilota bacterium]
MGVRKSYGKNKKTGRHELLAKTQQAERVRKPPKTRRGRAGRGR